MLVTQVAYPGLGGILSAQAVDSQGIAPARATITCAASAVGTVAPVGDFSFSDGVTTITWPECRVANVAAAGGSGQGPTLTILLEDARWKWSGGQISGRFNVPAEYTNTVPLVTFAGQAQFGNQDFTQVPIPPEEQPIRPETAKSAQQLCILCLKAMGVVNYDVSPIDAKSYPSVEWDSEVPARALQSLVERYGCRVVYRKDQNKVYICKEGIGQPLPDGPFLYDAPSLTPKPVPSRIVVRSAPIRYQRRFVCEWVMPEFDGSWRPANDVSYAPYPNGVPDWTLTGPNGGLFAPQLTKLPGNRNHFDANAIAGAWMYRAYRITNKTVDGNDVKFPNHAGAMTERFDYVKQVFLLPHQVQVTTDDLKRHSPAPAQAFGRHTRWHACGLLNPATVDDIEATGDTTEIVMPFTIDPEHGVIIFAQPVYLFDDGKNLPASVRLLTSCHFAPKTNWQWRRKDFSIVVPGGLSNLTTYAIKNELLYTMTMGYDSDQFHETGFKDNLADQQKRAEKYLQGELTRLTPDAADTRTYCGVLAAFPDGAIQQVTTEFAAGDRTKPATTVSVNTEHSTYLPNYQGRRIREEADLAASAKRREQEDHDARNQKGDVG